MGRGRTASAGPSSHTSVVRDPGDGWRRGVAAPRDECERGPLVDVGGGTEPWGRDGGAVTTTTTPVGVPSGGSRAGGGTGALHPFPVLRCTATLSPSPTPGAPVPPGPSAGGERPRPPSDAGGGTVARLTTPDTVGGPSTGPGNRLLPNRRRFFYSFLPLFFFFQASFWPLAHSRSGSEGGPANDL